MKKAAVSFLAVVLASFAHADTNLLGKISFPNSGAPDAQSDFLEGVLYMHNFEYDEANDAFLRAQEIDPDFALAYWGEAMVYNKPIWQMQAKQAGLDALGKLGRTPEERASKAPTQREKDYLHCVEVLFGTVEPGIGKPKDARDDLYREAMRQLHETYPDDDETATFYGLSILGSVHDGRDFAEYMRAAAVLTTVWDRNREHPGAAHYLIHSYDDAIHAPLGLPMARAYSRIAPSAAHAQHMTSHIFVALGMWDDLVNANEIAIEVENEGLLAREEPPLAAGHYPHWLLYGYLQQGRYDDAAAMMEAAHRHMLDAPKASERSYYAQMFARYAIDTGQWDAAERFAVDYELKDRGAIWYNFTIGLAAIERGNREGAQKALELLETSTEEPEWPGHLKAKAVAEAQLRGLIALHDGKPRDAVEMLQQATAEEAALEYTFGPPRIVKPSAELLGEVLLELDHFDESIAAFEDQLTRTPLRANTLVGLAEAAEASGNETLAVQTERQLEAVWGRADAKAANRIATQ
jgi:tetratricopeptide (TPR) repeat protein